MKTSKVLTRAWQEFLWDGTTTFSPRPGEIQTEFTCCAISRAEDLWDARRFYETNFLGEDTEEFIRMGVLELRGRTEELQSMRAMGLMLAALLAKEEEK